MCVYIRIICNIHIRERETYILYIYIYIHAPARHPATPEVLFPPPHHKPTRWGGASHLPPYVKMSYVILICKPRPPTHYVAGYLHAVFTYCPKYDTIYLQCIPAQ